MNAKPLSDSGFLTIRRALLSVSDKTGLIPFAQGLVQHGAELLSTGGTAKALREAGLKVTDVSEVTGFPEIMDGRVKTLHPKIHGGILARRDLADHRAAMEQHGIQGIDLVAITLYPFSETVNSGGDFDSCIENIDIGGPAMIRAAAKNHAHVAVVTDPADYEKVLAEMEGNKGAVSNTLRQSLALHAFALTASYDSSISNWLAGQIEDPAPRRFTIAGRLKQTLRYGENPHQAAALYVMDDNARPGAATATQVQGKELSYNNINDTNAAYELVAEFDQPAVAIIKHANPCGVAIADKPLDAYRNALLCDPVSAYGGIIAVNRTLTGELAAAILERFVEVIIAPDISEDALPLLRKKENIRVLAAGGLPDPHDSYLTLSRIAGGFLTQECDSLTLKRDLLKVVTDRAPTPQEMTDLLFAFQVCKHVKSNAIVYAKDGATVGIGAGQMSRIDSSRIAAWKAQESAKIAGLSEPLTRGSVVASDAFFPFADGLIAAAEAGVTAVIQPGGSIRDPEVIKAANERGLAMVLTGLRHFRH